MAAAAKRDAGGFDALFVKPLDKELECPICLLALKNPLQVSTCGHLFCTSCLDKITKDGKFTCPVDRKASNRKDAFPDLLHERKVLGLKVKCENSSKGCKWSGELRELEGHVTTKGVLQCDFVEVECQFNVLGCQEKFKKIDMKSHLSSNVEEHMLLLLSGYEALKAENEALKGQLREKSTDKTVFLWRIRNFSEHLEIAKQKRNTEYLSDSFYSGYPGYKLCLSIYPNGVHDTEGTHMGVFLHVMKGEFDGILSWPFLCPYKLTLLDQQPNGNPVSRRVDPGCFQRPSSDRNDRYGFPSFIQLSRLHSACFIQDDSIVVKVELMNT